MYNATPQSSRAQQGFTLLEVMVVMMIFGVISVLTYQGFMSMVDADNRSKEQVSQDNELQQTWAILLADFMQMMPRPPRDSLGKHQRAYRTNLPEYRVRFTRGGLLPYGRQGGLQQVAYNVTSDGELQRWVWPVLDDAPSNEPARQVLMADIDSFDVEQLNLAGDYEGLWPPLNINLPLDALPKMVRISIRTQEGLELQRVIPGVMVLDFLADDKTAKENRFPIVDAQTANVQTSSVQTSAAPIQENL